MNLSRRWRIWAILTGSIALLLASCSVIRHYQCRRWQDEGVMMSTLESCVRCANDLGTGNLDAVRGCALGLDAARVLGTGRGGAY